MKKTLLAFFCLMLSYAVSAQISVALHGHGTDTVFTSNQAFVDAYNAAQNGDTLYLSGGVFTSTNIDKHLVIYGAGHHPDSSQATGTTLFSSGFYISQNADQTELRGLHINGNLSISNNNKVDSLFISRCRISGDLYFQGNQSAPSKYALVKENVIEGYLNLSNSHSGIFSNNIVQKSVNGGYNNTITNNVIFGYNSYSYRDISQSLIANNIALRYSDYNCNYCSFQNNVFSVTVSTGNNAWSNNYYSINMTGFFVNQTGYVFDYTEDYHLTAPASYTGNDGSVVGIYGGMYPFKPGSVPDNPHIIMKNVDFNTGTNGYLHFQIKVSAE